LGKAYTYLRCFGVVSLGCYLISEGAERNRPSHMRFISLWIPISLVLTLCFFIVSYPHSKIQASPKIQRYDSVMLILYGDNSNKTFQWYKFGLESWLNPAVVNQTMLVTETNSSVEYRPRGTNVSVVMRTIGFPGQQASPNRAWNSNNKGDNKPLDILSSLPFPPNFEWLIIGDADSCFNLTEVRSFLSGLSPDVPLYLGQCPGRYAGRCCQALNESCPAQEKVMWAYGGRGYIVSKALFLNLPSGHLQHCARTINGPGSDLRVCKCFHQAGFGLSEVPPPILDRISGHRKGHCEEFSHHQF